MAVAVRSDVDNLRKEFILSLRKKQTRDSSSAIALSVINFLRKVIMVEKAKTISDLLKSLHAHAKFLSAMEPNELIMVNIVLMTSKLARDELQARKGQEARGYDSLYTLWKEHGPSEAEDTDMKKIKKDLIANIKELIIEIESCRESIASQSTELIFNQDVVMVHSLSKSPTLEAFFANACRSRKFRLLSVVNSAEVDDSPDYTTPIQFADVASKIVDTTKVVLPSVAVFPDGSCLVPAGGLSIALVAQKHSVPVYVLAPFYKMTPFFIPDPCAMNTFKKAAMPFEFSRKSAGLVEIIQPAFDMIPAQLINLFVSNSSCIIPAHINRLKEDYYHPEDISIY
ncbi:unnamed protein product [Caenorhabditis bovis]|uniref:Translation initiation factor eIF2B subunit beta n=1 Tax=Caenorhabditis bovis TaxID=2654633 RepID=A0A8S1F700_9PELO|nr:unnamed protein product [Caenorhabditis bovis]